jgi:hypothetical protein
MSRPPRAHPLPDVEIARLAFEISGHAMVYPAVARLWLDTFAVDEQLRILALMPVPAQRRVKHPERFRSAGR